MRTFFSISTAARGASGRVAPPWRTRTSAICWPTLRIGFSAVRGFWKIMESSRPRCSASSPSESAKRSEPPNIARPEVTLPAVSRMPITAKAVTDLPEPDSPTSATVSPLSTSKPTCSKTVTVPERVRNSTERSSTARAGTAVNGAALCSLEGIDDVAQPVAQKVEAEHRQHQRGAREQGDPPFAGLDEVGAFGHHDAPLRIGRAHAEADEGQAGRIED